MNTQNPKFWAALGFVVGILLGAGGDLRSPADALLAGIIQTVVWFVISTVVIRAKKYDPPVPSPDIVSGEKLALWKKIIGGFFFLGAIFMIIAYAFQAEGASLGAAIFNLIIGTPWFWPTARVWLNKIPFPQK